MGSGGLLDECVQALARILRPGRAGLILGLDERPPIAAASVDVLGQRACLSEQDFALAKTGNQRAVSVSAKSGHPQPTGGAPVQASPEISSAGGRQPRA